MGTFGNLASFDGVYYNQETNLNFSEAATLTMNISRDHMGTIAAYAANNNTWTLTKNMLIPLNPFTKSLKRLRKNGKIAKKGRKRGDLHETAREKCKF